MAKVLGETARYVTEQSLKKYQRQMLILVLVSCFFSFGLGSLVSFSLTAQPYSRITFFIFIVFIPLIVLLTNKASGKLEKERIKFRKGATGEALVGYILAGFPDTYTVIPGLKTPSGDIDHIVVGPTGVYAIDTKNWRGVVTADGKGELLLNGKPTGKPEVSNLFTRTMFIKNNLKDLTGLDPYIHAFLAFPAARVEARWGTTGSVHCVTDEQLYKYIVENKKGKKLSKKEIASISQVLLSLSGMAKDVTL